MCTGSSGRALCCIQNNASKVRARRKMSIHSSRFVRDKVGGATSSALVFAANALSSGGPSVLQLFQGFSLRSTALRAASQPYLKE